MSTFAAIASFALLISPILAQETINGGLSNSNGGGGIVVGSSTYTGNNINFGNQCPNGWSNGQFRQDQFCCPGSFVGSSTQDGYCCVGNVLAGRPSFASCFPLCSSTGGDMAMTTAAPQCSTTIALSDSDYSSKASAAASSINYNGMGSASTTASGSMTTGGASAGSSSGSAAVETGSSHTSTGAAAMMTSGPVMGAMMVAGGFLMAV